MVKDDDLRIELRTICLLFERDRANGYAPPELTTVSSDVYERVCKLALAHLDAEWWASQQ